MTEAEHIYEVKPGRTIAERMASALSLHTASPEVTGRGGIPELTASDWMAALAGSGDRLGEAVVAVKYLDQQGPLRRLVKDLHIWGMMRLLESNSRLKISAMEHRRLARMAVSEFAQWDRLSRDERMQFIGVGRGRWDSMRSHYADLVDRMVRGEATAIQAVAMKVR